VAILLPGSKCRICGTGYATRAFVATSGSAFPPEHDLFPFCDAALHLDCLERWPDRVRFSRGYFELARHDRDPATFLAEGSDWVLRCGPATPASEPYYAAVFLADWPLRLYARWHAWADLVARDHAAGLEGAALDAARRAITEVAAIAPDTAALARLRGVP
jgi:hypothetical protein